jgi:hypothetical protein
MTTDEIMSLAVDLCLNTHTGQDVEHARLKLRAAIESLRADAERYRWLMANATDIRFKEHWLVPATMHCLDASIDEARSKT